MTSVRFPKIGMVTKREDGSYDIDSIPGLGGPFDTAAEYFEAWSRMAKFPSTEAEMRSDLPPNIADKIIASVQRFPQQIKGKLHTIITRNEGPFPLYHRDFRHSNIIIDQNYKIMSIIDWDNAGTVPWEVVEFPLFLDTVPPPIDLPSKYDLDGNPIDEETQKLWGERQIYIQCTKEVERGNLSDDSLSTTLASQNSQNLATALRLYLDPGKLGFYANILEDPDSK